MYFFKNTKSQTLLILALFVTGLLGPAPAVPMSPLMTVNVQLGLFILLAFQLQLQAPTSQVSKSIHKAFWDYYNCAEF